MSRAQLGMQQLPPLGLPMGYFLTGPWFGVATGLLLLAAGPAPWLSRWAPTTLAATHLLVLGCMVMVMMGALVQVMPVISAAKVPGAQPMAAAVRVALGAGAVALAVALGWQVEAAFPVAGVALALAFGLYLAPLCRVLVRRIGGGDSMFAIRIAVLCLLCAVGLGLVLVAGHIWPDAVPGFRQWTDRHAGFGLLGWMAVLIMAVSYQVIPMFHVAPDYPVALARALPLVLVAGLLLGDRWTVGLACLAYAVATLVLLARRRRRIPDLTVRSWQLGMAALVAAVACWWIAPDRELLAGVLYVIGAVLTVMVGMLQKIAAFLVFTHLQRACLRMPSRVADLPRMDRIIPEWRLRWQLGLQVATVLSCVIAVLVPATGPVAAVAIATNFGWLWISIRGAHRCYLRVVRAWAAADAGPAPTVLLAAVQP